MKNKYSLLLSTLILTGSLAVTAMPARGQTNPPPPPITIILTNAPGTAQSFLVTALSLHDSTKQFFTNNIEVEFGQAAVIDSTLPGTMQATTLAFWKRAGTDWDIGGDAEIDTLGIGQDVSALYGHVNARLDWDNVVGGLSIGGGRQIDLHATRIEGGLLAEYRLTRGVGTQLRWYTGWQDGTLNTSKKGIYTRLELALTVALGK